MLAILFYTLKNYISYFDHLEKKVIDFKSYLSLKNEEK